jgi:GTPase involved in cell partitioning and DNA repair
MIVVATKLDATTNRDHLKELRAFARKRGLEFHSISSASGEGIVELVRAMADALDRIPKPSGSAENVSAPATPPAENHSAAAPHREER